MKEHEDKNYLVRLLLYPLILFVVVFAAYGIFLMTNKEINWDSVNKENNLYNVLLYLSNDLFLSFPIFFMIISNSFIGISFALSFVFFISILRLFMPSLKFNYGEMKKHKRNITPSHFLVLIFIILLIIAIVSKYFVTIVLTTLAITIIYIVFNEVLILLENIMPIKIIEKVKVLYKDIRKTLFYTSISEAIAIYLSLGSFTWLSYTLNGISYSIFQENMIFVLFGALNIILLIEIFEKYF